MIADLPLFAAVAAHEDSAEPPGPQAPRVVRSQKRSKRERREPTCVVCAKTWSELCDRPSWSWTDEGFIGMNDCSRCGEDVCVYCRVRYGNGTLCPRCFDLPAPTPDDARAHRLVRVNHFSPEYAFERMRDAGWRFEEPCGQFNGINPATIWYWQTQYDERNTARGDDHGSKAERRERAHRWAVVNGWAAPNMLDATWLPPEFLAFVAAIPRGGHAAGGWPEADGGDDADDDDD